MSDVDAMVAWLREIHLDDEQAALGMLDQNVKADMRGGAPVPRWCFRDGAVLSEPRGASGREILRARTWPSEGDHIARHDPRDTLARIRAEQHILDQYVGRNARRHESGEADSVAWEWGLAVRLLAWGYKHRDGYREGWAP